MITNSVDAFVLLPSTCICESSARTSVELNMLTLLLQHIFEGRIAHYKNNLDNLDVPGQASLLDRFFGSKDSCLRP